ncbi:P-loop containing nucleoside triphosphate hydrolase [Echria macrotheca]|uniref:P-loop containing nucleoside triphosphate hydrolase n=1 Tax=Echria macrotheca TaxID=438768 RepID=A0AAJ0BH33_9PEZI|nr:P-loop containing nucleoside triphosphate hydrolase [Echria macrotheca]
MDVLDRLQLPLARTAEDQRPVVVMTCGIAGSGKSTLSKAILAKHPNFTRLSIDCIVYDKHGLYAVDYPPELYSVYQEEADVEYMSNLKTLLGEARDVVVDRALYSREDRKNFKKLVEEMGGRWILVFFRPASKDVIWSRIEQRQRGPLNADSAFEMTNDILDRYWEGFEWPDGEGEVVVDVVE